MKLTPNQVSTARFHRRSGKGSCYKKLISSHPKSFNGSKREITRVTSPCDNSDDSGLGIENCSDYLSNSVIPPSVFRFASSQKRSVDEPFALSNKRHRTDLKTHNDLEDSYSFPIPPITLSNSNSICSVSPPGLPNNIPMAAKGMRRSVVSGKRFIGPPTLSTQLSSTSRNNKVQLQILNQPEQQHRARYQTEGSRGAVKDRTGNSFPIVKITGYNKPTTLQVFIGSDQGRVTPHMFYQACRVTGKNSTPCSEKNINGTIVIEIDVDPTKDMLVTCDCVGILKERNVDVEHRFPEECSTRSKKKSTRCRMVFRAAITNDDGTTETLQAASQPIACTQPPGIPEICKKSLTSCPAGGGKELFILGKNFLKDTHVMFQTEDWEQSVNPDKEFLQQTHLVCTVPSFKNIEIKEPVNAKVCVISGNRTSEPHSFTYTPMKELLSSSAGSPAAESLAHAANAEIAPNSDVDAGLSISNETQIKTSSSAMDGCEALRPVMLWQGSALSSSSTVANNCNMLLQHNDSKMMPPPVMLPRRSSVPMIVPDGLAANVKADAGSVTSDEMTPLTNATAAAAAVVAAANQMAAAASNPYVSTPYNTLPDVPIIQDFARNFHAINEVDHPTLKTEPVLKVEPLSESAASTNGIVEMSQQPSSVCMSSMKSGSLCTAQSNASMYLSDENYLYKSATELYPAVVSKTEPRGSPTEEMTAAFDVTSPTTPMMTANSLSSLMLPTSHPTHGYLSSSSMSDSNDMMVNMSPPSSNSSVSSASSGSVILEKQLPDKMSDMMASGLGDASPFKRILSPQSSPPQQLQQIQQPLSNCSLKQATSYDSLRNPFCYQNVVPQSVVTETNVTGVYHQNYLNLEPSRSQLTAAESVSSIMFKNQQSVDVTGSANSGVATSPTKPLSPLAMSMMENSLMPDMMRQPKSSSPNANNFGGAVMPTKSYLNSQSQDTLALSEYVPSALVPNPASTVPKLEELVNSAADSHIRSGNAAAAAAAAASSAVASMNLLSHASTAVSNTATTSCNSSNAQLALNSFLAEPQRQDVLSSVICNTPTTVATSCNVVASSCGMVGENPMLVPRASESAASTSVYQSCGGGSMVELSVAAAAVNKQMSMLEMKMAKEEKSMSVNAVQAQQMAKKSAEGMFPSEISRMSERDLLNYINPSCFDEVPRWKNI